jgi:putative multiple sugar transport system substrate-binding protein
MITRKRSLARLVALATAAVLALGISACSTGGGGDSSEGGVVGISMPTKDNERWMREATDMTDILAEQGYTTDVQFAGNDVPTQVSQIENMIAKGAKALVITAIDGAALSTVLDEAGSRGIPVFAYTRLLMNTDAVSYYTTFDYYMYGKESALSIARGLGLLDPNNEPTGATGPFNVELVAGSATDNVAIYMYDGFWDVFGDFVDKGIVKIQSGQTEFEQVATLNWDGQKAQSRMENIIASAYSSGEKINAVWVPYDGLTRGVISALQDAGYEPNTPGWPYLPGGDAEIDSIKAILAGEQYSTVFTDTRKLSETMAQLVLEVLADKEPSVTLDTKTYDNGNKIVPAILIPVVNVTKDTVVSILVDSGFVTKSQIGLE